MMPDRIAGHSVLFVMAAEPEYGPSLRRRINPLMTGVGPVEAAVNLTATLARLEMLPSLIVSLGSAGSRTLPQTEVYQVSAVAYRDMDASPLGFPRGQTPFLDLPAVIDMPLILPGIRSATLATGASIVSGAGYDTVEAQMVDMETYAHLRGAAAFGIPLIGLRGISDGAAELQQLTDWTQYLHVIDERLADAVDLLETAIAQRTVIL